MGLSTQIKKQINSAFFNPCMFKNEKLQKPFFNLSAITERGYHVIIWHKLLKNLIILCFPHVKKINNLYKSLIRSPLMKIKFSTCYNDTNDAHCLSGTNIEGLKYVILSDMIKG